jgi:hypothetical protein
MWDMAAISRPMGEFFEHLTSYGYSPEHREYMKTHPIPSGRGSVSGRTVLEGKVVEGRSGAQLWRRLLLRRANQRPAHISLDIHILAIAAADLNQHRRLEVGAALCGRARRDRRICAERA